MNLDEPSGTSQCVYRQRYRQILTTWNYSHLGCPEHRFHICGWYLDFFILGTFVHYSHGQ